MGAGAAFDVHHPCAPTNSTAPSASPAWALSPRPAGQPATSASMHPLGFDHLGEHRRFVLVRERVGPPADGASATGAHVGASGTGGASCCVVGAASVRWLLPPGCTTSNMGNGCHLAVACWGEADDVRRVADVQCQAQAPSLAASRGSRVDRHAAGQRQSGPAAGVAVEVGQPSGRLRPTAAGTSRSAPRACATARGVTARQGARHRGSWGVPVRMRCVRASPVSLTQSHGGANCGLPHPPPRRTSGRAGRARARLQAARSLLHRRRDLHFTPRPVRSMAAPLPHGLGHRGRPAARAAEAAADGTRRSAVASAPASTGSSVISVACSSTLRSSRMLPGQACYRPAGPASGRQALVDAAAPRDVPGQRRSAPPGMSCARAAGGTRISKR